MEILQGEVTGRAYFKMTATFPFYGTQCKTTLNNWINIISNFMVFTLVLQIDCAVYENI